MFYPWLELEPTLEASNLWMLLLLGFSTAIYAFMLTVYRFIQRIFRRNLTLDGGKVDFDERNLVRAVGLYWFIPLGLVLHLELFNHMSSDPNFGKIMIIEGLSISLGAWISRFIKK